MFTIKCNYQNRIMKNYQKITTAVVCIGALAIFAAVIVNNYKTKTSFKHNQANASVEKAKKAAQTPQDKVSAAVNKNAKKAIKTPTQIESDLLKISSNDIVLGDANAPVTMFEYSSLSCPHCAAFSREAFAKIEKDYIKTKKVKFVHRDFPLNQPALAAAMFAICQADSDAEKYHYLLKALFKTQDAWAFDPHFIEKLRSIAQLDGMSAEKFDTCINNEELQNRILKHRMAASESLGITSTPTFFINGEKSSGYVDYLSMKKMIDAKLAQSK